MTTETIDYILVECELELLVQFVESLEGRYTIKTVETPSISSTMIKAKDTVEAQPFYLGEALTTTCVLQVNSQLGYGIVLEDQPQRAYCIAFINALHQIQDHNWPKVDQFLKDQQRRIDATEAALQKMILKTKVDFKLMEEEDSDDH